MEDNMNMDDIVDLEEDEFDEQESEKVEWSFWQLFRNFFRDYASYIIPGLFTILGIFAKDRLDKKEYDSTLYTTDEEGNVYKTKAKRMHTISPKKTKKVHVQQRFETD